MSYHEALAPECERCDGVIDLVVKPKERDIGDFTVKRLLPAAQRRMVGPFIFFDHMGPAEFPPGRGINVRPHPHIGIATITYLFEGEIMHRDSLGTEQSIHAGAVNLMTAGRGISHSERPGSDVNDVSHLHGIQSWMVLPNGQEEIDPEFMHTAAKDLPEFKQGATTIRVIMGSAYGHESPVKTYSPILYLDCQLPARATLTLPEEYDELAAYVVSGNVEVDSADYGDGVMVVACPDKRVVINAQEDSRVMVIGGAPTGERHIWWNFVSSSKDRIEQAKNDWREDRFGRVPGETEFIPLPS